MTLLLKETFEQRILRIADSFQPAMRAAFLAAVKGMKESIPVDQITALLEEAEQTPLKLAEALDPSFSVFDELQAKLKEDLKTELIAVVEEAALPTVAEFGLDFSVVNERARRFATDRAGRLITEVAVETQEAIADIVAFGLREGVAPRQQALLIRELVGLTRRDALAVDRFLNGAIDSGLNRTRAQAQAKRMADRLLKRRAENIARTETMRAANMGTELGWVAAQDVGLLPQGTQKVWIATEDSRTCPICAVLDENTVSVGDTFSSTQEATAFTIDGDEIQVSTTRTMKRPVTTRTPPAHPSCRCTIGLTLVESAAEADPWSSDEFKTMGEDSPLDWDERNLQDMGTNLEDDEGELLNNRAADTRQALRDGGHGDFADWTNKWVAGSQKELNRDISDVLNNNTEAMRETPSGRNRLRRAKAAIAAMDNPPTPKPNTLYRGISLPESDTPIGLLPRKWPVGFEPKWGLQSFASESSVADVFANAIGAGNPTPVVFEWVQAGKALQLENLSTFAEAEWLGAGTFRVLSTRFDDIRGVEGFIVTIEQIATPGLG